VISALLEEDLFASDLDPLDTQTDQSLRTPDSSSDASRDVEQHGSFPPDFSPTLGCLPADPDPDHMPLDMAQCLENVFAPKASTPDLILSGPGSSAPIHSTSCAEGYRYDLLSESQVERPVSTALTLPSHDHGFSLSQDNSSFKFVTEGKYDRKRADSPSGDTHLQGSLRVVEDVNLPMVQFASGNVCEWDSYFHSDIGVEFVAMEF